MPSRTGRFHRRPCRSSVRTPARPRRRPSGSWCGFSTGPRHEGEPNRPQHADGASTPSAPTPTRSHSRASAPSAGPTRSPSGKLSGEQRTNPVLGGPATLSAHTERGRGSCMLVDKHKHPLSRPPGRFRRPASGEVRARRLRHPLSTHYSQGRGRQRPPAPKRIETTCSTLSPASMSRQRPPAPKRIETERVTVVVLGCRQRPPAPKRIETRPCSLLGIRGLLSATTSRAKADRNRLVATSSEGVPSGRQRPPAPKRIETLKGLSLCLDEGKSATTSRLRSA